MNIYWFRRDLRLEDNSALDLALQDQALLIYIFDEKMGSASKWWLHNVLISLSSKLNNKLNFYQGNSVGVFKKIIENFKINNVFLNEVIEPEEIDKQNQIIEFLQQNNISYKIFPANLLLDIKNIKNSSNDFYKVFTPFYNKTIDSILNLKSTKLKHKNLVLINDKNSLKLEELCLLSKKAWYKKLDNNWNVNDKNSKHLSPYLHFGQISVQKIFNSSHDIKFKRKLIWREFSYYILYNFPQLSKKNWQKKFNDFPWEINQEFLKAWQEGKTGYPFVDAGMRELYATGFMDNRLRMVCASFLVKNLLIHWQEGEKWFFDCLVDADLANNSFSWQWVAGSGFDSAPYFRIFNPITQGKKFDANGIYTKKYVPELKKLPIKYLFSPWLTPLNILQDLGITLGVDYPKPLIDLGFSRERALLSFYHINNKRSVT